MRNTLKYFGVATAGAAMLAIGATLMADHHGEAASDDAPERAEIGKKAPEFELEDLEGNKHRLSDYRGKIVVIEWFNGDCPWVVHQYQEGVLKEFANKVHRGEDTVYLAINSNRPGSQGAGHERNVELKEQYKIEFPILMDKTSEVGRAYQARRTPEMYVIDTEGILRYQGAIDNAPMGNIRGDEFINYVENAINQIRAGETVSPAETRPYGCTVKYPN